MGLTKQRRAAAQLGGEQEQQEPSGATGPRHHGAGTWPQPPPPPKDPRAEAAAGRASTAPHTRLPCGTSQGSGRCSAVTSLSSPAAPEQGFAFLLLLSFGLPAQSSR